MKTSSRLTDVLLKCIVEQLVFFELSSDEIVNPDAAVNQMELIAFELSNLMPDDKDIIINYVKHYTEEQKKVGASSKKIEFLESLSKSIGLADYDPA